MLSPPLPDTHTRSSQKRQPSYPKQDELLHSLPPTDSGDNDDRHAKRKETKRVSQPLCYADAATLPRIPYPSMHLSAVTHTPPPIRVFPRSPPASPRPIQFFSSSILSRMRAKETWGILLTPHSLPPAHINHPLYEKKKRETLLFFFFNFPQSKD